MSKESIENHGENIEPEKLPEEATDMELAMFLIGHIDNPCEAEVEPGVKENIRDFYIREAEKAVQTIANDNAKSC